MIHSFLGVCRTDGRNGGTESDWAMIPSPHRRRHRHRHQHRPTSKCACGRHILLIHLVHSGNDSPTFALEREKGGKMLADWIWITPRLFLTPLTSHVLCVFFFCFPSEQTFHSLTSQQIKLSALWFSTIRARSGDIRTVGTLPSLVLPPEARCIMYISAWCKQRLAGELLMHYSRLDCELTLLQ